MQYQIFTVHHRRDPMLAPFARLFTPVQAGAANAAEDLGVLRDDTGPNISARNPNFCELTVIDWLRHQPLPDYVGLMHYRRMFIAPSLRQRIYDVAAQAKFHKRRLSYALGRRRRAAFGLRDELKIHRTVDAEAEAVRLTSRLDDRLDQYDAVLPLKTRLSTSMRDQYGTTHPRADFDDFIALLAEREPDMAPSIAALSGFRHMYCRNMFIFRREIFLDYARRLMGTLKALAEGKDLSGYDPYQARIYGFLAERFTAIYAHHLARQGGFRLLELPVAFLAVEGDPP